MTDSPALPAGLAGYVAARDAQHAAAVAAVLGELTARERHLVHDAAVMGYVRGRMHPKDEPHLKDSAVVAEVIDACLALPDLYPGTNAVWEIAMTESPAVRPDGDVRQSIAEALARADGWEYAPGLSLRDMSPATREQYARLADVALSVLPAPTDRAAVLREAAGRYEQILANAAPEQDPRYWTAVRDITLGLRRMADEAQQGGDR